MADPYKYFRVEAHEIVGELAQGLRELETRADVAVIAKLLRHAHTLKGAARIVRHTALAELAHALETALGPLREAPVAGHHDAAVAILDQMTAQLATLADKPAVEVAPLAPPPARVESVAVDDALGGIASLHAMVARLRGAQDPAAIERVLDQLERELAEVRRDVEHLRLSAAGSLYTVLERTARDAATLAGKRVRFAFEGADVRVDGAVITALQGALVQLVRNAVVHGIDKTGTVTIRARARGTTISIACEDDGRGLDLAAIRAAVAKRGGEVGDLDAGRAFQLLLRGGISTTREVTELSGRGIGLELVSDAVRSLGGEVTVATGAHGTTIALIVPVAVTAIAVINVALGDRIVAIPQAAVRRVSRIASADLIHGSDGTTLVFDDITVPAAPLAALFGGSTSHGRTAVFVAGDALAAFTVDRTLGIDDVVVRSVPAGTPIDPIVWGMAIDAEGQPYPVVEPHALVAAVRRAQRAQPAPAKRLAPILVVDDSLTTRMLEQSILESAGYDVELAVSAEDALAKLASTAYAMMLADVEMPGMDGFSLVAEVRARPAIAHLPAVLVTSRDAPADRERGAAVGAQGYVVKGRFDQGELLALIRRLVQP